MEFEVEKILKRRAVNGKIKLLSEKFNIFEKTTNQILLKLSPILFFLICSSDGIFVEMS